MAFWMLSDFFDRGRLLSALLAAVILVIFGGTWRLLWDD